MSRGPLHSEGQEKERQADEELDIQHKRQYRP